MFVNTTRRSAAGACFVVIWKTHVPYSRPRLALPAPGKVVLGGGSGPRTLIGHNFLTSCSIIKVRHVLKSPRSILSRAPRPRCPRCLNRYGKSWARRVSRRFRQSPKSGKFLQNSTQNPICQRSMESCQRGGTPRGPRDAGLGCCGLPEEYSGIGVKFQ